MQRFGSHGVCFLWVWGADAQAFADRVELALCSYVERFCGCGLAEARGGDDALSVEDFLVYQSADADHW